MVWEWHRLTGHIACAQAVAKYGLQQADMCTGSRQVWAAASRHVHRQSPSMGCSKLTCAQAVAQYGLQQAHMCTGCRPVWAAASTHVHRLSPSMGCSKQTCSSPACSDESRCTMPTPLKQSVQALQVGCVTWLYLDMHQQGKPC